ncbi:hypothetical protein CLV88_11545 [Shimia abyssi]|uniref:Uncharacterized protein n=1 Tax=Shimia abyssi TaxID=1662395 RepID=A0A2P8F7K8_9RHOB|nr:hypothetical protein CLV88_11545 [Shimia abyssi]
MRLEVLRLVAVCLAGVCPEAVPQADGFQVALRLVGVSRVGASWGESKVLSPHLAIEQKEGAPVVLRDDWLAHSGVSLVDLAVRPVGLAGPPAR